MGSIEGYYVTTVILNPNKNSKYGMPRQCSVHVQPLLKKKSARHADELKVYCQIISMNTYSEC